MLSALPTRFLQQILVIKLSLRTLPLFLLLTSSPISAQTVTPGGFEQLPPVPVSPGGYVTNSTNTYDFRAPNYNQATPPAQPTTQYQYSQNNERYLVIVNSNSPQVLQQVRQIEPTAYFRAVQGGSVIQAGTFTRITNVQNRLRQLADNRIGGVRVFNLANGQEMNYASGGNINNGGGNNPNPNPNYEQRRSDYYYVAIPGNPNELITIENKIRGNIGQVVGVIRRNEPRGTHIAVGPFSQRLQAEQWNNYLQNMGFDNSRVYYGK
ncbi:hypothetical protein [Calothrix sp. PCC 6303]|uniref:hypothetical protein n=1 Tax=Calothrix sp. PCC 6303 TaxID=1170562 RepID=UPI0002A01560|nr:hypothetical protein [Calothrix sp. PCC 6303]AFY99850.1 hypothetical protein Cal6303_0784 [Calothrix sp. PCC 6303]